MKGVDGYEEKGLTNHLFTLYNSVINFIFIDNFSKKIVLNS